MKKEGKAIILISEEMAELIGMADKIIITNTKIRTVVRFKLIFLKIRFILVPKLTHFLSWLCSCSDSLCNGKSGIQSR